MGKSSNYGKAKGKPSVANEVIHRIDWAKVTKPNSPSANSLSRNRPGRSKKG